MLIRLTAHISMVTHCTLISALNHLTACGKISWRLKSRCKRSAFRMMGESWVLAERGEEACKAFQLCLLQSWLVHRQMREMEALESHNSLGELRDKKALDFQRFSLSNQLLIAVTWLVQIEGSFPLVQFYPWVKGTDNWQGPMSCLMSSDTKEWLDCVGNAVLQLESKSIIMQVCMICSLNSSTLVVCQWFLLEW